MLKLIVQAGPDKGSSLERGAVPEIHIGPDSRRHSDWALTDRSLEDANVRILTEGYEYVLRTANTASVTLLRHGLKHRLHSTTDQVNLMAEDVLLLGENRVLVEEAAVPAFLNTIRRDRQEIRAMEPARMHADGKKAVPAIPPEVLHELLTHAAELPRYTKNDALQAHILRGVFRIFGCAKRATIARVLFRNGEMEIDGALSMALVCTGEDKGRSSSGVPERIVKKTLDAGQVFYFRWEEEDEARDAVCAPLSAEGRVIGVLVADTVSSREDTAFPEWASYVLQVFANYASQALLVQIHQDEMATQQIISQRLEPHADFAHWCNNILQKMMRPLERMNELISSNSLGRTMDLAREKAEKIRQGNPQVPWAEVFREAWIGTCQEINSKIQYNCDWAKTYVRMLVEYQKAIACAQAEGRCSPLALEDLENLFSSAKNTWENIAAYGDLHLAVDTYVDPNTAGLCLASGHLLSIVNNLMSNGLRAIEKRLGAERNDRTGRLTILFRVDSKKSEPRVALYVMDDGCGMSERQRLEFTSMQRIENYKGQGLGLGRMLVRLILRRNQGGMEFASVPGTGTIVKCWFPQIKKEDDFAAMQKDGQSRWYRQQRQEIVEIPWNILYQEIGQS